MSDMFVAKGDREREFKVHIEGCKPHATFTVRRELWATGDRQRVGARWFRDDLEAWLTEKRREYHVNAFMGRWGDFVELTFFYEPHAIEYALLWDRPAT